MNAGQETVFMSQGNLSFLTSRQGFGGLQNPNCCSRRTPMKMRLIMLASRWMRPACNQVQLSSRHAWFPCTTFCQSRAPYLFSLRCEDFGY